MNLLPKSETARAGMKRAVVSAALLSITWLAFAFLQRAIYDHILPNHAGSSLAALSVAMLTVGVFALLMGRARQQAVEAARAAEEAEDVQAILQKALRASPELVTAQRMRDVLREAEAVREVRNANTVFTAVEIPFAVVHLAVIGFTAGVLVFVPLVFAVVNLGASFMAAARMFAISRSVTTSQAVKARAIEELGASLDGLRLLGAGEIAVRKAVSVADDAAVEGARLREASGLAVSFGQTMAQWSSFATLGVGCLLVFDGSLSMGGLIIASILAAKAVQPFVSAAGVAGTVARGMAAAKTVKEFMGLPEAVPATPAVLPKAEGRIGFHSLSHKYPGTAVPSLDGLNLEVPAGRRIAVVGANGSGKSTLWKALTCLVEPSSGSVEIDGFNVRGLDREQLRRLVGVVEQRPCVMSGSILDNLKLGNTDVSDETVAEVCGRLGMTEWIRRDERGFQRPLLSASDLSAGQLQQLAIARLILRDPLIWVLDEHDSHLDSEAATKANEALKAAMAGRTAIVVTHKQSLIDSGFVDSVAVLAKGKVVRSVSVKPVVRAA